MFVLIVERYMINNVLYQQLSRFKLCVSNRKTGDVPPLAAPTVIPATPPTSTTPDETVPDDVDDDIAVVIPVVADRLKFFLNPL